MDPKKFAYYRNRGEYCWKPEKAIYSTHSGKLYRNEGENQECLGWVNQFPFTMENDPLIEWINERVQEFFGGLKERHEALASSEIVNDTVNFIMGAIKEPFVFETDFENQFNELLKICAALLAVTAKSMERDAGIGPDVEYRNNLVKAPALLAPLPSFILSLIPDLVKKYSDIKEAINSTDNAEETFVKVIKVLE